jgi:hypothetical protein
MQIIVAVRWPDVVNVIKLFMRSLMLRKNKLECFSTEKHCGSLKIIRVYLQRINQINQTPNTNKPDEKADMTFSRTTFWRMMLIPVSTHILCFTSLCLMPLNHAIMLNITLLRVIMFNITMLNDIILVIIWHFDKWLCGIMQSIIQQAVMLLSKLLV